jgi:hypothetical protein
MSVRRPRIKASSAHLAALAGKRRVVGTTETKAKDDDATTEEPSNNTEISPKKCEKEVSEDMLPPPSLASLVIQEDPAEPVDAGGPRTPGSGGAAGDKGRPLLKSRFRPNLSEADQQRGRLRRFSGCEAATPSPTGRTRTISGSSEPDSTAIVQLRRPPAVVQRVVNEVGESVVGLESTAHVADNNPHPGTPMIIRTRQLSENSDGVSPAAAPPSRTRRLTESKDDSAILKNLGPTVFDQRKADHKKKFVDGIPERTRITMFDLIYYNPSDGNRMSNPSSMRSSRAPSIDADGLSRRDSEDAVVPTRLNDVAQRLQEEAVDDDVDHEDNEANKTTGLQDDEEDTCPVPQVKVAPDGSIIIDEASTLIETTAAKKAKEDLLKSPLVFESANQV